MRAPFKLPPVIGHRGACGYAPENTLASIREAALRGASWVELDVCITQDAMPILMHDEHLSRTTSGEGLILRSPFSELRELDAGSWFGEAFASEGIPTLEETLDLCTTLNLGINLEIKPTQGFEAETAEVIGEHLAPYANQLPLLISSFNHETLLLFQTLLPNVPRGYITDVIPRNWQQKLESAHCMSLHFYAPFADPSRITAMKAAGYQILSFTVNQPEEALALFELGVDAVFSDYPDRIQQALLREA